MRGRLPAEILTRTKMGFPTPLAIMFRNDLTGYLSDLLLDQRSVSRGYFKPEAVREMIAAHVAGTRDHHKLLWQLVVLEEWHRRFAAPVRAAA
jgi:asparagine synthase (glutamine-hydrolysing)